MFSSVDAPFCCATTTRGRPSSSAMPPTIAGSSRKDRSPCSSWKRVNTRSMRSSACGRWRSRASLTASHAETRALPSSLLSTMRYPSDGTWPLPSAGLRVPRSVPSSFMTISEAPAEVGARAQRGEEERDALFQLGARDDLIDEAVGHDELRALEARGKPLADRLVRDARAG